MSASLVLKCDFCEFARTFVMLSFCIEGRMLAACSSILNHLAIALVVVDELSASCTSFIILSSYGDHLVALVNLNPDCNIAGCENVIGVGAMGGCSSSLYWLSELSHFTLCIIADFP
jgi:hypothetical protein